MMTYAEAHAALRRALARSGRVVVLPVEVARRLSDLCSEKAREPDFPYHLDELPLHPGHHDEHEP